MDFISPLADLPFMANVPYPIVWSDRTKSRYSFAQPDVAEEVAEVAQPVLTSSSATPDPLDRLKQQLRDAANSGSIEQVTKLSEQLKESISPIKMAKLGVTCLRKSLNHQGLNTASFTRLFSCCCEMIGQDENDSLWQSLGSLALDASIKFEKGIRSKRGKMTPRTEASAALHASVCQYCIAPLQRSKELNNDALALKLLNRCLQNPKLRLFATSHLVMSARCFYKRKQNDQVKDILQSIGHPPKELESNVSKLWIKFIIAMTKEQAQTAVRTALEAQPILGQLPSIDLYGFNEMVLQACLNSSTPMTLSLCDDLCTLQLSLPTAHSSRWNTMLLEAIVNLKDADLSAKTAPNIDRFIYSADELLIPSKDLLNAAETFSLSSSTSMRGYANCFYSSAIKHSRENQDMLTKEMIDQLGVILSHLTVASLDSPDPNLLTAFLLAILLIENHKEAARIYKTALNALLENIHASDPDHRFRKLNSFIELYRYVISLQPNLQPNLSPHPLRMLLEIAHQCDENALSRFDKMMLRPIYESVTWPSTSSMKAVYSHFDFYCRPLKEAYTTFGAGSPKGRIFLELCTDAMLGLEGVATPVNPDHDEEIRELLLVMLPKVIAEDGIRLRIIMNQWSNYLPEDLRGILLALCDPRATQEIRAPLRNWLTQSAASDSIYLTMPILYELQHAWIKRDQATNVQWAYIVLLNTMNDAPKPKDYFIVRRLIRGLDSLAVSNPEHKLMIQSCQSLIMNTSSKIMEKFPQIEQSIDIATWILLEMKGSKECPINRERWYQLSNLAKNAIDAFSDQKCFNKYWNRLLKAHHDYQEQHQDSQSFEYMQSSIALERFIATSLSLKGRYRSVAIHLAENWIIKCGLRPDGMKPLDSSSAWEEVTNRIESYQSAARPEAIAVTFKRILEDIEVMGEIHYWVLPPSDLSVVSRTYHQLMMSIHSLVCALEEQKTESLYLKDLSTLGLNLRRTLSHCCLSYSDILVFARRWLEALQGIKNGLTVESEIATINESISQIEEFIALYTCEKAEPHLSKASSSSSSSSSAASKPPKRRNRKAKKPIKSRRRG